MATLSHALAALVLGNFRFASFLERAHSAFQICEPRFNHLMLCIATHFFAATKGSALLSARVYASLFIKERSRETPFVLMSKIQYQFSKRALVVA